MASERTKYVSLNSPNLASLHKGTASSPIWAPGGGQTARMVKSSSGPRPHLVTRKRSG